MIATANLHPAAFPDGLQCRILSYMARNPGTRPLFRRTYFKEWREHRGKTQAQVVGALELMGGDLPTTAASLSRLENGKQPYSQPILEALAEIYDAEPADLIAVNPLKERDVIDFMRHLSEDKKRQVLAIAEAVIKTGT